MGLEPRVQLGVAGRSENFLVDTGGYLLCADLLLWSLLLPNLYHLGCYRKNNYERSTRALLCCWDGQIFPHQFLVVPDCPPPLLGRNFPAFETLQLLQS